MELLGIFPRLVMSGIAIFYLQDVMYTLLCFFGWHIIMYLYIIIYIYISYIYIIIYQEPDISFYIYISIYISYIITYLTFPISIYLYIYIYLYILYHTLVIPLYIPIIDIPIIKLYIYTLNHYIMEYISPSYLYIIQLSLPRCCAPGSRWTAGRRMASAPPARLCVLESLVPRPGIKGG